MGGSFPENKLFFVAHEFFDAIPVHQFEYTAKGWCEVLVDIDETEASPMHFRLTRSQVPTHYAKSLMTRERFPNPKIGDRIEISPDSWTLVTSLSKKVGAHGGAGLIIDYGENGATSDSLRVSFVFVLFSFSPSPLLLFWDSDKCVCFGDLSRS